MIGIQLDGDTDFLDVDEDTSLEMTINNPLLGSTDVLSPGSYTLPFNIPVGKKSPKNAAKLKHPEIIENNQAYQIQKASLTLTEGLPFKRGKLKSTNIENDVASANFFFGLNSLNPSLKTARLRDVMNEVVVIDNVDRVKTIYLKKIVNADWSVTINGKQYSAANINALAAAINADNVTGTGSGNYMPFATVFAVGASPGGIAAPYLSLRLTKPLTIVSSQDNPDPLAELSVTVDQGDLAAYKFESFDMTGYYDAFKTFLANYISGAFPSDKYRFPVRFNANLYQGIEGVVKTSEVINGVSSLGLLLNDWVALKNNNSIQPYVLLKYVLDKIASTFGFALEGDFYEDPILAGIQLENSNSLDVPLDFIGNSKYVFWRRSFNVNELVPDITVIDFLKGLASRYNLGIYPNDVTQKVRLKKLEAIARSNAYSDITSFASPMPKNEDYRVTGFSLLCKKDDTDLFSINESFDIGQVQDTIPITCGRLFQLGSVFTDGLLIGPRVSVKNNEPKFTLRVFHFLGMVDNGVFSYQRADIHGEEFFEGLGDFILNEGIYSRCFKYWLTFRKNWKLITLQALWPLRLMQRFDFETKLRFDRTNYLLSSMKLKITNKTRDVVATEMQLLTMR